LAIETNKLCMRKALPGCANNTQSVILTTISSEPPKEGGPGGLTVAGFQFVELMTFYEPGPRLLTYAYQGIAQPL